VMCTSHIQAAHYTETSFPNRTALDSLSGPAAEFCRLQVLQAAGSAGCRFHRLQKHQLQPPAHHS
jgi:hypothetical protein